MPSLVFLFVNALFFLSAFYLARRLIPSNLSRSFKAALWLVFFGLSASFPLYFFYRTTSDNSPAWVTYSMGFFSLLLTFTVIRDVLWLFFRATPWHTKSSPERRDFLRNSSRLGILTATTAVFGKAVLNALGTPTLHRVSIPIKDLPAELEGFSIAQISYVHVGQLKNQTEYLAKVIETVNSCQADVVAVTGDIVDGSVMRLAADVAPLAHLKGKLGTFFVTGNHEYYSGAPAWIEHFKSLGWDVLQNEHRVLQIGQQQLIIAGVHDLQAKRHVAAHACNPTQALANAPSNAAFTLLLAHHPGTAHLTDDLKIDLQISGHTHAGQYFPATWVIQYFHKFARGLNPNNQGWVYVNSGTGYWGPALRTSDIVGEVTLLTLTRAT